MGCCEAGNPAKEFAGVGGESEVVELKLGDGKEFLELGGVGWEVGVCSVDGLEPYGGYEGQPLESH